MKNLKVSLKLTVSFLVIIILAAFVGGVGILGMYKIDAAGEELYTYNLLAIGSMGEIREELQRQRNYLRDLCINAGNSAKVADLTQSIIKSEAEMQKLIAAYEATITDDALETAYYDAKKVYENDFKNIKNAIIQAAAEDTGAAEAALYDPNASGSVTTMVNGFTTAVDLNSTMAKDQMNANAALFNMMTIIEIVALIVAIAIALFFSTYISKLVSAPLLFIKSVLYEMGAKGRVNFTDEEYRQAGILAEAKDEAGQSIQMLINTGKRLETVGHSLERIADGDLTEELTLLSDVDTIGLSMRKMLENLNGMFSDVNNATAQVANGAKQIADGSQALAQGATEQAATVQELSSSISEIAEKTKENAAMADKAAALANVIKGNAEKGSLQMNEMMAAVKEINDASRNINKVIKVIDDIAFQTNILALNAAVEAARAGQHGKGFAVVAEEVRNLAAKSAEAAKDTGSMIASSIEKAELGARIADDTATSLIEIVAGINESTQLVGVIAKSSEEQSANIMQINTGIDQVAQVVQQNSATAQESAAASQEMSGQSDMLQNLVSRFKTKGGSSRLQSPGYAAPKKLATPKVHAREANSSFSDFSKY